MLNNIIKPVRPLMSGIRTAIIAFVASTLIIGLLNYIGINREDLKNFGRAVGKSIYVNLIGPIASGACESINLCEAYVVKRNVTILYRTSSNGRIVVMSNYNGKNVKIGEVFTITFDNDGKKEYYWLIPEKETVEEKKQGNGKIYRMVGDAHTPKLERHRFKLESHIIPSISDFAKKRVSVAKIYVYKNDSE